MHNDIPASDPMAELAAMKIVAEALSKLDAPAKARVLQWAAGSLGVKAGEAASANWRQDTSPTNSDFESLPDLYSATSPNTDADRALVAGYWIQFIQGEEDFASQTINSALKNLGHGVGNITMALDALKAQSPALVMQLRKAGTTRQARKKYKLTAAGKKAVELLITHS